MGITRRCWTMIVAGSPPLYVLAGASFVHRAVSGPIHRKTQRSGAGINAESPGVAEVTEDGNLEIGEGALVAILGAEQRLLGIDHLARVGSAQLEQLVGILQPALSQVSVLSLDFQGSLGG